MSVHWILRILGIGLEVDNDGLEGGIEWVTFLTDIIGSWTVTVEIVRVSGHLLVDGIRVSMTLLEAKERRQKGVRHVCFKTHL